MTDLADVEQVQVPRELAEAGQEYLREAGEQGFEGIVLWAGKQSDGIFLVHQTIFPRQEGRRSSDGLCYVVDGDELFRINQHLYRHGHTLIAQVHSHPGEAYHSEVDDTYAVASTEGCLSIVIPDFAIRPFSVTDCAVFRLRAGQVWAAQSQGEVAKLVQVVD